MLLIPTVVALYNAHKERLARISAAAFASPQVIFPVSEPEVDKARAAKLESDRVRKERLKATWKKKAALARGPVEKEKPAPFFGELLHEVAIFYDTTTLAIKSQRRDAKVIKPRQVLCYLAYTETAMSFPAIGRLIGNRDHTTILYAVRKIEKLLKDENDEDLAVAVITIRLRLQDRVLARRNRIEVSLA